MEIPPKRESFASGSLCKTHFFCLSFAVILMLWIENDITNACVQMLCDSFWFQWNQPAAGIYCMQKASWFYDTNGLECTDVGMWNEGGWNRLAIIEGELALIVNSNKTVGSVVWRGNRFITFHNTVNNDLNASVFSNKKTRSNFFYSDTYRCIKQKDIMFYFYSE